MSSTTRGRPSTPASHASVSHAHGGREDPTGTTILRRRFGAAFYKRFQIIKKLVKQGVGEEDRLSLSDTDPTSGADMLPRRVGGNVPPADDPPDVGDLPPQLPPAEVDKLDLFQEWYEESYDNIVVGPSTENAEWSEKYIRYAYEKGVNDADTHLGQIDVDPGQLGATFDMPVHKRMIRQLLQQNYNAIDGLGDATKREIGRVLADGLVEGVNPKEAARRINDRVDKVGLTRARVHARTQTIKTYNEASLTRYEQALGSDGEVTARAEWLTAGDSRVCERCRQMQGRTFTIKKARGMIPLHPQCRCSWIPVR